LNIGNWITGKKGHVSVPKSISVNSERSDASPLIKMDFANGKRIPSYMSFERNSIGTYVSAGGIIKTAGIDVARFDHEPLTGKCKGLLCEWNATNFVPNSDLSTGWLLGVGGDTFNVDNSGQKSPDGTDARVYNIGTGSGWHRLYRTLSVSDGSKQYTASCFFKPASGTYNRYIEIELTGTFSNHSSATFDLQDLTTFVHGTGSGYAKIEKYRDGWYRCSYSFTPGSTAGHMWFGFPTSLGLDGSMTGDGTDGMFMWGAQVEQWPRGVVSSYIPTSSSTVTRAYEYGEIKNGTLETLLPQWIRDYTVFTESSIKPDLDSGTNFGIFLLRDDNYATNGHGYFLHRHGGSNNTPLAQTGNTDSAGGWHYGGQTAAGNNWRVDPELKTSWATSITNNGVQSTAFKQEGSQEADYKTAGLFEGRISTSFTKMSIGNSSWQSQSMRHGWIAKVAVYGIAMNENELKTLVGYNGGNV